MGLRLQGRRDRTSRSSGGLVYVSPRKLIELAAGWGMRTGSLAPCVDVEAEGGLAFGPPGAQAHLRASARGRHVDPGKRERQMVRLLDRITDRLHRHGMCDLEAGEGDPDEGHWIRFHRPLRFGVGCDDSTHEVKALIAVDAEPVRPGLWVPGLIMNGSAHHVRPPYRTAELLGAVGSRSGSGTGQLFIQWTEYCRAWEERGAAELPAPDAGALESRRGRHPDTALSMYRLFAGDGWLDAPGLVDLHNGAPCEGLAQVSYVAVGQNMTLVMASPLYIRIRPTREA